MDYMDKVVWAMLPFVACAFAMGLAAVHRIHKLQQEVDQLRRLLPEG